MLPVVSLKVNIDTKKSIFVCQGSNLWMILKYVELWLQHSDSHLVYNSLAVLAQDNIFINKLLIVLSINGYNWCCARLCCPCDASPTSQPGSPGESYTTYWTNTGASGQDHPYQVDYNIPVLVKYPKLSDKILFNLWSSYHLLMWLYQSPITVTLLGELIRIKRNVWCQS